MGNWNTGEEVEDEVKEHDKGRRWRVVIVPLRSMDRPNMQWGATEGSDRCLNHGEPSEI